MTNLNRIFLYKIYFDLIHLQLNSFVTNTNASHRISNVYLLLFYEIIAISVFNSLSNLIKS